jgi:hypothetical protein
MKSHPELIPGLTLEQLQYNDELTNLNTELYALKIKRNKLYNQCNHIAPRPRTLIGKYDEHGGASCVICDKHLGWVCTKSPDHVCHYYSSFIDGKHGVELIDGTIDYPTDLQEDDYSEEDETDDCCIYCHQPDERK